MSFKWKWKSDNYKKKCALYRSTEKRKANKIRRMKKHIKKLPNDLQAINLLSLV